MHTPSRMSEGWILIDKPVGISSFDVVRRIRKKIGVKKVGHAGTLDPMASGLMIIAAGRVTRLLEYVLQKDKQYIFTIKWGESTDTLDAEGNVVSVSSKTPSEAEVEQALPSFFGRQDQVPPQFSAISVGGKRAYSLARAGVKVELKARPVEIFSLKLLKHGENESTFDMHCSKGCYVRSLARDFAHKLGVCGHVSSLRRTKIEKYDVNDAFSLDYFLNMSDNTSCFLSMGSMLDDIPVFEADELEAEKLCFGVPVEVCLPVGVFRVFRPCGAFIAICHCDPDGVLKPVKVFV